MKKNQHSAYQLCQNYCTQTRHRTTTARANLTLTKHGVYEFVCLVSMNLEFLIHITCMFLHCERNLENMERIYDIYE